jgi:hypothetical protein
MSALLALRDERPRKILGFEIPAERFNACVASTACAGTPKAQISMHLLH